MNKNDNKVIDHFSFVAFPFESLSPSNESYQITVASIQNRAKEPLFEHLYDLPCDNGERFIYVRIYMSQYYKELYKNINLFYK